MAKVTVFRQTACDAKRQSLPEKVMKPVHTASQPGFTLIELMIVVSIVGILAAVLLNRVPLYQELAEKTAMEQIVGVIRSALHLQIADYIAKGKMNEIPRLARDNPMNWLAEKPKNYLGEYFDPKPGELPAGNWYYDLKSRELVYLVDKGEYFVAGKDGHKQIRFRLALIYNDAGPKVATTEEKELGGVVLQPEPYTWKAS